MKRESLQYFLLLILSVNFCTNGIGQVVVATDTSSKKLEILKAVRYTFQKIDSVGDFVSVAGNVLLKCVAGTVMGFW